MVRQRDRDRCGRVGARALTLDPAVWFPSTTREYQLPNDRSCFVTIAIGPTRAWIDCPPGKSGTEVRADAHALAAVCGIALRHGTSCIRLVTALKEITHEGSADVRLAKRSGAAVALSIADAIGDALWQELV